MAQFFSSDSIITAYRTLVKNGVRNKFFGLLSLLRNADTPLVVPGITYEAYDNRISQWLDDVFFMEEYSNYNGGGSMYFKLAVGWDDVVKEMSTYSIDFVSLFCFIYKFNAFDGELTINQMMVLFLKDFHISEQTIRKWCSFTSSNIEYTTVRCSRLKLKAQLAIQESTITMETPSVKARAGELARAPFIQTLYAGLDAIRCMIISKCNLEEYYPTTNLKPLKGLALSNRQIIYYGAPGTGKSNKIDRETTEDNRIRTTFHPDSDYSTFVGAYKPTMKKQLVYEASGSVREEEQISYSFVPQAFMKAYVKAWERKNEGIEEPYYLVIEEINRGNCAQIFGDLFQLLDRDEKGYSKYEISPDEDIQQHIAKVFKDFDNIPAKIKSGEVMKLPNNLYIWATMNTSDQSLFPIDSAFKRRWDWEYVPISYDEPKSSAFEIEIGGEKYSWVKFIEAVNKRIFDLTQSEDKEMGNFFIKSSVDERQFKSKVMFYLWNEVLRDEVENSKYFFYAKDDSGNTEKFTFKDLYEEKATETLQGFMRYLGVPQV